MSRSRGQRIRGWTAVSLSTLIAGFWAFWGIVETFHEGWYYESVWMNLGLTVVQYLGPMLAFLLLALAAIRWPRPGFGLYLALAAFAVWFFSGAPPITLWLLMVVPLVGLGLLYLTGRPEPRRWAVAVVVVVPLLTLLVVGAVPGWRVAQRVDDGNRGLRQVEGNGVVLEWAPAGPGWPERGGEWSMARDACRRLEADGKSLADEPVDLWRLPTADEVVRSLTWRGENAGGAFDPKTGKVSFATSQRPNKETPLWDPHTLVIYWWASSEAEAAEAPYVSYNGWVHRIPKSIGPGYIGFRCVRKP